MGPQITQRQPFRESDLRKLNAIYKRAARNIIDTFDGQSEFEQWRRVQILAQIDAILAQAGVETGTWLTDVLPATYQRGTRDVLAQLGSINATLKDASAFSVIDQRAVDILVSETQQAFATSLTTVGRAAGKVMSDIVKAQISEELAQGVLTGSARRTISKQIIATIKQGGITGLIDKGGREWTLENYAEMLARTKMMEARNSGVSNKMIANGYDLVEITRGMSSHQACRKWEGRVVSLTGKTKGYPTLEDARKDGVFHPRCQHHYNIVHSDLALMTKEYRVTEVVGADGKKTYSGAYVG